MGSATAETTGITRPGRGISGRAQRPWVMVAEDDPEMRRLLCATIEAAGLSVASADSGPALRTALARAGLQNELPALIVSDICMPGQSGLQVLQWLHSNGWPVPVVLITAFVDDEVIDEATRLGAARVLSKPFDLEELSDEVVRLVPPRDPGDAGTPIAE